MINHGITFADYCEIDALNASTIKKAIIGEAYSMKHLRDAIIHPDNEDSTAKRLGRLMHARLLEPEEFDKIPRQKTCSALKKNGDPCTNPGTHADELEWFCGVHKNTSENVNKVADFATFQEIDDCERMMESLHNCEILKHITAPGWSEAVATWSHNGHGLKCRIDRLAEDYSTIIDLKTIERGRGSNTDCRKQILNYRYDIQMAMNIDGVHEQTGIKPCFIWVFIEKKSPFDVNVIEADSKDYEIGRREYLQILQHWKLANEHQQYFGYLSNPNRIRTGRFDRGGLPRWFRDRDEFADIPESAHYGDTERDHGRRDDCEVVPT